MAKHHTCPVWIGYLLISPLRKLVQHPVKILTPYIEKGMTVMDFGSAMGFFTLPMAKMVGGRGRVIAVDMQQVMLDKMMKRARKAGVDGNIIPHACGSEETGLENYAESVDFVLAMAVVHELTDPCGMYADVFAVLKPGGKLLVCEPADHVSQRYFDKCLGFAKDAGFVEEEFPTIWRSRSVLLQKPLD